MTIETVDIGQFAALATITWIVIQMFRTSRKRESDLAVWRKGVDMKLEQNEKEKSSTEQFLDALSEYRGEAREEHKDMKECMGKLSSHIDDQVDKLRSERKEDYKNLSSHIDDQVDRLRSERREDYNKLEKHIDGQVNKLDHKLENTAEEGRAGRKNLHERIDHLSERIDHFKK